MKRQRLKRADRRDVAACIEQLQALVEGLRAGRIGVQADGDWVQLSPAGEVEFELRIDQQRRKEVLRIDMCWQRSADSVAPVEAVASESAPAESVPAARCVPSQRAPAGDSSPVSSVPPSGVEGYPAPALAPQNGRHAESDSLLEPEHPSEVPEGMATAEYRRMYDSARVLGSDGLWHIDQDRLVVSLAAAGVDPLTQQELYALALQADADGRASMLSERFVEALERVSQSPPLGD